MNIFLSDIFRVSSSSEILHLGPLASQLCKQSCPHWLVVRQFVVRLLEALAVECAGCM